ncbi:SDR family NAD(P)-dependent oxidoreductase [Paenibacillus jiagnxiensis]|uniref:SDR family NAD(P)-dependent oxidoreductase n=1 Tax=Paenibacillus jiagnxiensis TaxID=3228926 RepID=UPI0033AA992D
MGRLTGKVALVTGAGNGQGAAEAKLMAKEGAKVIATDINFENVTKVVEEINAENLGSALAFKHDVSSKEDWIQVVEEGVKAFGPITVLVNNAGILAPTTYDKLTHEHWSKVMDVNAWSQFVGMQTVIPYMKKAGIGSIINIASMAVVNSSGAFTAYTASKGAVDAFSRAAAIELAPFNIRVNSVLPGTIYTSMVEDAFPDQESMDAAVASQPLGRMGRPVDVAYLVVYLASDEAYFTTGTSQLIDGGFNVQASGSTAKIDR